MKKIIFSAMVCFLVMIGTANALDTHVDWVPVGWVKLAEGTIQNVSNMGPFFSRHFLCEG
jgi:hypothetical protein